MIRPFSVGQKEYRTRTASGTKNPTATASTAGSGRSGFSRPRLRIRPRSGIADKEIDELESVVPVLGVLDELWAVHPAERALLGELDVRHVLTRLLVDPVGEAEARRLAHDSLPSPDGIGGHEVGAGADLE